MNLLDLGKLREIRPEQHRVIRHKGQPDDGKLLLALIPFRAAGEQNGALFGHPVPVFGRAPTYKSGTGGKPGLDMNPDATPHKPTLKFDADARFAIRLYAEAAGSLLPAFN